MGRPTGLEPPDLTEAKSLEFADLVECYFLGIRNKMQGDAANGGQLQHFWQPCGNPGRLALLRERSHIKVVRSC